MPGLAAAVDLGTTYTAAAVRRPDGVVEMVTLGPNGFAVPSAVFVAEHGGTLVGDAALDRGQDQPDRLAREFKRRLGDPTPYLLGGAAYSADRLTGELLRWVLATLRDRYGEAPGTLVLTHPANWGDYKRNVFEDAIAHAGAPHGQLLTEPEAAALHYAAAARVDAGELVAVYDLGGGTFDAVVLERTAGGFTICGEPKGIERLGGVDLDHVVRGMVTEHAGLDLATLDASDPTTLADLAELHERCVRAKVALSADTATTVRVRVGDVRADVRITRTEFEARAGPTLAPTIEALQAAIAAAGTTPDRIARVLLVGGSSRIPIVAAMVSGAIGRPVAVDADPKGAVAMGAATFVEPEAPSPATTTSAAAATPPPPEPGSQQQPAPATPPPATAPPATAPPAAAPPEPAVATRSTVPGHPPAAAGGGGTRRVLVPSLAGAAWPALTGAAAAVIGGLLQGDPPFLSTGSFTALVAIHAAWLIALSWLTARALGRPPAATAGDQRLWAVLAAVAGAWLAVQAKSSLLHSALDDTATSLTVPAGMVAAGAAAGAAVALWRGRRVPAAAVGGALAGVVHAFVLIALATNDDNRGLAFLSLRVSDLDVARLLVDVAITAAIAFLHAVLIALAVRAFDGEPATTASAA